MVTGNTAKGSCKESEKAIKLGKKNYGFMAIIGQFASRRKGDLFEARA